MLNKRDLHVLENQYLKAFQASSCRDADRHLFLYGGFGVLDLAIEVGNAIFEDTA